MSRMAGWRRTGLILALAGLLFRIGLGFGEAVAFDAASDDRGPDLPLVLCTPHGVREAPAGERRSPAESPHAADAALCPLCLAACAVMAAVLPVPVAAPAGRPIAHAAPAPATIAVAGRPSDAGFHPRAPPLLRTRSAA